MWHSPACEVRTDGTMNATAASAAGHGLGAAVSSDLPPLPSYTLVPRAPIIAGVPDGITILIPPVLVYWIYSLFWHFVDVYDLLPQYRLHTPLEVQQRNRASRREVVRDVLLQQAVQTLAGAAMALLDEPELTGQQHYAVALWALRLRRLSRHVPRVLGLVGLDSVRLAASLTTTAPGLAGFLRGGRYPGLTQTVAAVVDGARATTTLPAFAAWELRAGELLYYYAVPALQFLAAIIFVDSWEYFLHRAMHMNKWLYTTFHSRHHRLYVPYAFGALYNHPVEGFLLDTAGTGLAYLLTGLSARQAIFFFSGSTIKTIDDHCGYRLPYDPLQRLTGNNAAYHDIHHQSWGIKTNFAQPFFTFWDRVLGTMYVGDAKEMEARYVRGRERAEAAVAANDGGPVLGSVAINEPEQLDEADGKEASATRRRRQRSSRRSAVSKDGSVNEN
ncbi:hypothetical protein KEM52_006245 [Ascosphaera acerosa]|nr:hypothetical protein KEM52_006245 [Ascosphaera acerosa]